MRVIIIGGGAAGSSCATRLRRLNETAEILVLEKTGENSIASCGLPYFIGDVITNKNQMQVAKPELFKNLFNIEVIHHVEVTHVDVKAHQIYTQTGACYDYDKLVIATGVKPIIPAIIGQENIPSFCVKSLADADKIKSFIQTRHPKSALIVGAGYIGIEMAENLTHLGLNVHVIDKKRQILPYFDPEMARILENKLTKQDVVLHLGSVLSEVDSNGMCHLSNGDEIKVDMLIFALGVQPETSFLHNLDIALDNNGAILTNEYMQTNQADIYAAGDAVAVKDFVLPVSGVRALAGPANRQGRLIADHIMGYQYPYTGTQGTSIIKVFDTTAAITGANEEGLKSHHIPYQKMVITSHSHAGYYPGGSEITFKLLYNQKGEILGASAIGAEGVDKTINVVATMMRLKGTIYDMRDAELCYAPPYSSAKDVINLMGMAIENQLRGLVDGYFEMDFDAYFVLDVRPTQMYQQGHISGAVNIPFFELRNRLDELPTNKPILVYCVRGYTSYVVTRMLLQHGFKNVVSFAGGWQYYQQIS